MGKMKDVDEVMLIASELADILRRGGMAKRAVEVTNLFKDFDQIGRAGVIRRIMVLDGQFGDRGFSNQSLNIEYQSCIGRLEKALDNIEREARHSGALEDPQVREAWDLISDNTDLLLREG